MNYASDTRIDIGLKSQMHSNITKLWPRLFHTVSVYFSLGRKSEISLMHLLLNEVNT